MKWALELSEFDIRYKLKTAIKGQVLADFVMEFTPAELAKDMRATPDLPIWKLFVDGAVNAQGSCVGLILTSHKGIDIDYALRFGFRASNSEAEYEAVIAGLNLAHSMEVDQLEVCSDSQLVVKQIEDTYEAKGEKMILYLKKVRELLRKFVLVQVRHIPRAENSRADALAKLATASQEDLNKQTPVEHLAKPSIDLYDKEVSPIMSEPSWMDPIWDYLIDELLPDDPKEASKLRTRPTRFTIHKGSLYKRGFFTPILNCIAGKDVDYVLREVHEGVCRNHIGARTLAGKALRPGILLAHNAQRRDRTSQEAQSLSGARQNLSPPIRAADFSHKPLPIGKGQCKFVVVAVDYFTKWAEAEPLATITKQKVCQLRLAHHNMKIWYHKALVSNNGKQFDNPKFRDLCVELWIKNYYSSQLIHSLMDRLKSPSELLSGIEDQIRRS